eukprot:389187_1
MPSNHSQYMFPQSAYGVGWKEAQYNCEQIFGTSLATIITEKDVINARYAFQRGYIKWAKQIIYPLPGMEYEKNISIWIGMYTDSTMHNHWQWTTHSGSTNFVNNSNWAANQPAGTPGSDSSLKRYAAELRIAVNTSGWYSYLGFYDTTVDNYITWTYLCNGPESTYQTPKCSEGLKCWNQQDIFLDAPTMNDLIAADNSSDTYTFQPPIAHWNNTLFLVGEKQIHYTDIHLHQSEYEWTHNTINEINFGSWNLAQRYAQYESYLYLYTFSFTDNASDRTRDYLLQINLINMNVIKYFIPYDSIWDSTNRHLEQRCIVALSNAIYIFRKGSTMMIFTVSTAQWYTKTLKMAIDMPLSCVMGNDDIIYVLDGGSVYYPVLKTIKIDKMSGYLQEDIVSSINLCANVQPFMSSSFISSFAAANGKLYFQGCDVESWQTLIFDTKTQMFNNSTVDIFVPNVDDTPYYRSSQLTSIDDNILLSFSLINGKYPSYMSSTYSYSVKMHFTVTDLVSINLISTLTNYSIWPSDGLTIRYKINDFGNNDFTHNLTLFSQNPYIKAYIKLTKNDSCVCNCTQYCCCDGCYQQFQLSKYLSFKDNNISQLLFRTIGEEDTVIYPNEIPVTLTRCGISLYSMNKSITNKDRSLTFRFNLTNSCQSRTGSYFYSLNVKSAYFNISTKLTVYVNNRGRTSTNITCKLSIWKCDYSYGQGSFVIYYETNNIKPGQFNIIFESNTIDFQLLSPTKYTLQYFVIQTHVDKTYLYLLLLLIVPVIVICIMFIYCKIQYNNAYVVDKALVLIIGISNFSDDKLSLVGVPQNVLDLEKLWRDKYNYEVIICADDSTKRNVEEFIDQNLQKISNVLYKAVIVHIISHGTPYGFICSDLKEIQMEFMSHELIVAEEYSDNQGLLKLIFHHGCRGDADYSLSPSSKSIISPLSSESRGSLLLTSNVGMTNVNDNSNMSAESNLIIVSGNIVGRTMSDEGHFTQCIVDSFEENTERLLKADFYSLFVQIGNKLEKRTNSAELCNISGTFRYHTVRLEKCKDKMQLNYDRNDMSTSLRRTYVEL